MLMHKKNAMKERYKESLFLIIVFVGIF